MDWIEFASSNTAEWISALLLTFLLLATIYAVRYQTAHKAPCVFLKGSLVAVVPLIIFYVALALDVKGLADNEPMRLAIFRPLFWGLPFFWGMSLLNGRIPRLADGIRKWIGHK